MINSDPMTMTDEEMITEFLDVIRICKKHDNMKLAFAETIWTLEQYRRAEIAEYFTLDDDGQIGENMENWWDAQHPNWPEEAK